MQIVQHRFHTPNIGNAERGASIIAGSLLIYSGVREGTWRGAGLALTGAALVGRGVTGFCGLYETLGFRTARNTNGATIPYELGIRVDRAVTVNRPRFEVYSYWRNLENLPTFMKHLVRVRPTSDKVSHWVAVAPLGRQVEWDAEMINDVPGEMIAWRSLPGADVDNAGSVHFEDAPGDRGTVVRVALQYNPPAGVVGALISKLFGEEPSQQVDGDLRRFKMMLETGELPSATKRDRTEQPKAPKDKKPGKDGDVQAASEQSFPASDAPAWT